MKHLDEGTIHAWLDGALSDADAREAEAHVATCADCAALAAEARGLVAGASRILGALDDTPAVQPKRAAVPASTQPKRMWQASPWVTGIAAALILAVGTRAYFNNRSAEQRVTAFARTDSIREQLRVMPPIDSALRDAVTPPRLQPVRQTAPAPAAAVNRASGGAGAAGAGERAQERLAVAEDRAAQLTEKREPAMAAPAPAMVNVAPSAAKVATSAPTAGLVETIAAAPAPELKLAGCYRLPQRPAPNRLEQIATAAKAPRRDARAPQAAAAAPSAREADPFAAPPVVQLDTTVAPQGRVIRAVGTGAVLGYWSGIMAPNRLATTPRDSVRLMLLVAGPVTVAADSRIECEARP